MQPFPSPLQPVPAVKTNDDLIHNMQSLVSNVIAEWQGEVDGDVLAMWDIAGTAITDWERVTNKQITDMERRVRRAATQLFGTEEDQTGTNAKDVVGTTTQVIRDIETPQTREGVTVGAVYPAADGQPPKACKCIIPVGTDLSGCIGTCGTLAWCPGEPPFLQACRPYNCGDEIPPGWCVIGGIGIPPEPPGPPEPPYPGPPPVEPPEKECCPKQIIQVMCPENMNRQRPGPCAEPVECDDQSDDTDEKPLDDSRYPPDEKCEVDACYKRDGKVLPDEWTKIPLALNDGDDTEHVHSECGQAVVWKHFADFFSVKEIAPSNDPKEVAVYALGRASGSFEESEGFVTEYDVIDLRNKG